MEPLLNDQRITKPTISELSLHHAAHARHVTKQTKKPRVEFYNSSQAAIDTLSSVRGAHSVFFRSIILYPVVAIVTDVTKITIVKTQCVIKNSEIFSVCELSSNR